VAHSVSHTSEGIGTLVTISEMMPADNGYEQEQAQVPGNGHHDDSTTLRLLVNVLKW
jgi:hypothetical protein